MKKILFVLAVVLMASCQETLEERGAREARDYTEKHCPTPVASNVVMDSMTFDKATHTFGYYYTLKGTIDDTATIRRNNPRDLLLQQVRNSTNLKTFKEAGYNFRYIYYSEKNTQTVYLDILLTEKDYQ